MLDLTQRFAAADPATTPPDGPLPDEALALLDRVMTPRPPAGTPDWTRPVPAPRRRSRLPRMAIGILVPVLVATALAAAAWGWLSFLGRPAPMPEATPAPSSTARAAWIGYATEQDLIAASDAILTASTLSVGAVEHNDESFYVATVRVISATKGPFAAGQYLHVAFPDPGSGEVDEYGDLVATGLWPPGLQPGDTALLFLRLDSVAGAEASLVTPLQGSYQVGAFGTLAESPENPVFLDDTFLERMGLKAA